MNKPTTLFVQAWDKKAEHRPRLYSTRNKSEIQGWESTHLTPPELAPEDAVTSIYSSRVSWMLTEGHYILVDRYGPIRLRVTPMGIDGGPLRLLYLEMQYIPPWLADLTDLEAGQLEQGVITEMAGGVE